MRSARRSWSGSTRATASCSRTASMHVETACTRFGSSNRRLRDTRTRTPRSFLPGAQHCSGAPRALGVGPGDEVVTQAFTFVATVEAILEAGATPVIAEIDASLNLDVDRLEERLTPRTKAIVPVHMAGAPANMSSVIEIAARHDVLVLEDVAQSVGGSWDGRPLGTIGHAGTLSFDFAKNLTTGEGGAVLTNDVSVYERARALHDHGHEYNATLPRGRDTRSRAGLQLPDERAGGGRRARPARQAGCDRRRAAREQGPLEGVARGAARSNFVGSTMRAATSATRSCSSSTRRSAPCT